MLGVRSKLIFATKPGNGFFGFVTEALKNHCETEWDSKALNNETKL